MKLGKPKMVKLRTVTPIFIGTGEAIKPLSYLVADTFVHVLKADMFFEGLTEQERQRYLEWIDPILNELSRLDAKIGQAGDNFELKRQVKRQRREIESRLSIEEFISSHLRANPITFCRARNCIAYSVKYATKPGNDGYKLHLKDNRNNPYIPGTEIKGALRTSLLYALLSNKTNYDWLRKQLSEFRLFFRSGVSPRDKVKKFQEVGNNLEQKALRGIKDDAKFDFFKLVHISDSTPCSTEHLQIEATQSTGTQRYTKILLETIAKDSEFACEISTADELGGQLRWALQKLGLERLAEWLSVPKLVDASFIRSRDILKEEARYFNNQPQIQNLIAQLQQQNQPDSPLLRLGAGQGFLSITIDLLVKIRDERIYDEAVREGVSFQRRWRTQRGNFPKTRRVIVDHRGNLMNLLGWVKLHII